ncbi:hypothetical protein M1B72_02800 [Geomonas paludis]|uniref:SnoaL-like domain-containing protein n=1 Tax=Geomonas paludis TaxID=2740185 RepID=A0ABY4LJI4_9BACT|nr:hypothetical protein [Geomonas paludis]UPU36652.1 hypothetical protein M1B72_02800 [Geomonas paludis]
MPVLRPLLILILLIAIAAAPSQGARRGAPAQDSSSASEAEVLKDFETILDLWRDGRFDELYQHTNGGRDGREKFANRLASAPRKPACCWEKIQEARVSLKSGKSAVVQARLGFEASTPGTEFVTKSIHLKREGSGWSIAQSEIYSLADLTSKKRRYKYLPIQPKK